MKDGLARIETNVQEKLKRMEEVFEKKIMTIDEQLKQLRNLIGKATGDIEAHDQVLLRLLTEEADGDEDGANTEVFDNQNDVDVNSGSDLNSEAWSAFVIEYKKV